MDFPKEYTDSDFIALSFIRISMNLSQIELAEYLGVTSQYISLIEKNKRPIPSKVLTNWLKLLNVSYDDYIKLNKYIARIRNKDISSSLKYAKILSKTLHIVYPDLKNSLNNKDSNHNSKELSSKVIQKLLYDIK